MTVKQRTTTAVPGSREQLLVTIDDITGGQVMLSLSTPGGPAFFGPQSITPRHAVEFQFAGHDYRLTLKELNNALIGQDFATFRIAAPGADLESEVEKIERLIETVRAMEGAVFIRNGTEHSPQEAADHLRSKLNAAGNRIKTAEQFIDEIASESSLTGNPYQIRLPNGSTVPAGELMRTFLAFKY